METVIANLAGKVRRATLGGRDYLVAPLTMIVPGVLSGSQGSLLYTPEEIARDPQSWNGMPLTARHPTDNQGRHVSARSPDVLEKQGIGHVFNATANGKLVAEGWFDVVKTEKVDPRILQALQAGQAIELSTGLFTENTPAPSGATHNGRPYDFVARSYRPDHVAVLVDDRGACSLQDGCGVLVNKAQAKGILDRFLEFITWPGGIPTVNADEPMARSLRRR